MNRLRKQSLVFFLLCLLLALAACSERNQTANEGIQQVRVVKATKGALSSSAVVSGKLEGLESADIVPKISGRIARIPVDIGSQVEADDLLFSIDNADLAAAVNQAEAGLALAQASFEVSRVNYERGKLLLKDGAISQSDYDSKFELSYKTSQQQVAQSAAALNMARANYSNTIVTAPFSGVVTNRRVNTGEMATQQVPVVSLVDLSKVVVKSTVSELLVNKLEVGQKVPVKVSAVGSEFFEGTITNIALAADSSSKAYPVKIQIDNPDKVLKPGMFAEGQLGLPTIQSILVPRVAVLTSDEGNYVYIVKDEAAQKLMVKVGSSDGKFTEITGGLEVGQEVIVEGIENLVEGSKVQKYF